MSIDPMGRRFRCAKALARCVLVAGMVSLAGCATRNVTGVDVYCDAMNPCLASLTCSGITHVCRKPETGAGCLGSSDCLPDAPVCGVGFTCHRCTEPADDAVCAMRGAPSLTPFCEGKTGACVACRISSDCRDPGAPVCDANVCRGCTDGAECPSLLCARGACIPEDRVVYVDKVACAAKAPTGKLDAPYCEIADAIAMLGSASSVHVAGSAIPYTAKLSIARDVNILGPGRLASPVAVIMAAALDRKPTIEIVSGTVLIDGIGVSGGNGAGVTVAAGSTLTLQNSAIELAGAEGIAVNGEMRSATTLVLDGNLIHGNRLGGIRMLFTTYSITNQVIVSNATNVAVSMDSMSTGTFAWNTIARNTAIASASGGIQCGAGEAKLIEGSIFVDNTLGIPNGTQIDGNCTLMNVATGVDARGTNMGAPEFRDPNRQRYELVAGNMKSTCCIDAVDADVPVHKVHHDWDGRPRPVGKWDLGAFEWQPNDP